MDGGLGAGGRGEGAGDGRGRLVTGPGASCLVRSMTYSRQWASHAESMMNQSWIGLRLGLGLGIAFGVARQGQSRVRDRVRVRPTSPGLTRIESFSVISSFSLSSSLCVRA